MAQLQERVLSQACVVGICARYMCVRHALLICRHTSIGMRRLYMSGICASGIRCVCIGTCIVCACQACVCSYTVYALGMRISVSGMRCLNMHAHTDAVVDVCIVVRVSYVCMHMHMHTHAST